MTEKTIRIVNQQWQGGMNKDYSFGARLLSHIVPPSYSADTETIFVPISEEAHSNGQVDAQETLLEQFAATKAVLTAKDPARIITLGGDCSVSEVPFDYLHGKYPKDLGLIWLDAHPDVSAPANSHHVHEMVLANLLQHGVPEFNQTIENPFKPSEVLLAGLRADQLRPMDGAVGELGLKYLTPQQLQEDRNAVKEWIRQSGFKHIAVHFDLDVLDPADFRAILPAEPGLNIAEFGAAIGSLKLSQVLALLEDVSRFSDLVGLTIAEHMPWDALRLRKGLATLPIFQ